MLSAILSLAAPAILGPAGLAITSNAAIASAIGGGLGKLLEGGSQQDALGAAALGGLGSFLGGKLGGATGGSNIAGGTMPGFGTTNPAVTTPLGGASLPSAMTMQGGTTGAVPGFTDMLTRPEAIGAGIGASLAPPPMMKPKEEEEIEMPRGMPIENTSIFPEMGYDAGKMGEFNYRIPKNFAEGGEVESDIMPMDAGIGGMMDDGMNDKELISSAIDVIQGEINDPDQQKVILSQFVAEFGQEALQDLIQKVQGGEIPSIPKEGDGMVKGAGDGMADMIPANMEGDQDVLLSDGEFVVPADVVSGLGNGSSDAGADKLEDMMDRVRQLRTGGKTQPPAIPDEMMLPA
tara:strand:- start:932 stop:1975 length:1044 start_codon:yes stop_codon:yes gene_type:complete